MEKNEEKDRKREKEKDRKRERQRQMKRIIAEGLKVHEKQATVLTEVAKLCRGDDLERGAAVLL